MAGLALTGRVLRLFGGLGTGKTEFVRGLTAAYDSSTQVRSPSFTLVNTYPTVPPIYHADLYRIDGEEEYADLDLEAEASDGILVVEWAERAGSLLEDADIDVTISYIGESDRRITIVMNDQSAESRLKALLDEDSPGAHAP